MTNYTTYTDAEIKKAIKFAKECADAAEKSGNIELMYEFHRAQIELEGELVERRYNEFMAAAPFSASHQNAMQQQATMAAHQNVAMKHALQQQQFDSVVMQQNFDSAVQRHMDAANSAAMNCSGMMF